MELSDFSSMKSLTKWKNIVGVRKLCVIFVWLIGAHGDLKLVPADYEVADNGFISIDCGASENFVDETTGIWYQTDEKFVGSGTNHKIYPDITAKYSNSVGQGRQLETLRSFPEGDRNCYILKPRQGKNQRYLIRAIFLYYNYDYKNQIPIFHLFLGVNFWAKIQVPMVSQSAVYEIIQQVETPSLTDMVHVCLVNTGQGTPFINTLELRPLNSSIYSPSLPLNFRGRYDLGSGLLRNVTRYKDDVYDRLWWDFKYSNYLNLPLWDPFNTTAEISTGDSAYKLPLDVLRTAVRPLNQSNFIFVNWTFNDISAQYCVFLHFAEIEMLPSGYKRIINVTFGDDESLSHPLTLQYLKPVTLSSKIPITGYATFRITSTAESAAPPILNAFEIYEIIPQPNSPSNAQDANAITNIKNTYRISRITWQGDPFVPSDYAWDGLNCSTDKNPRIISLNLSSSKLTGQIDSSFTNLEKLESLDLSNNELTGQIPEFLANLPKMKFLNLTGNKLTGSIPKSLREKADLQLSVANNPGLCQTDSCKEHKFVIPLIASIAVLIIIVIVSLMIWRLRRKRLVFFIGSKKAEIVKQKNQAFSYSQILLITNNFETVIGEGGFGKVYLGTLEDDTQVAVKVLSESSKQGFKEFQSEAQLLTIIHHRNLVSLVGYCHQGNVKALIYEYMDNGDLSQLLSEKNPYVLKWNERLQVAVDAAKGLEYLHNGCKTPIIHRDIKPSNILINKVMVAKIADFGLSRAFTSDIDSHLSTQPAGTLGYIDPEFQRSGNLNKKSDIYSFGMILLQLITGQPPIRREPHNVIFILDWVRPKIECGDIQGIVDPRLAEEFSVMSAWKAVEVAMACVSPESTKRPDISLVSQELSECLATEMEHAITDRTTSSCPLSYNSLHESISILSAR